MGDIDLNEIARVALAGVIAYPFLVVLLRLTGKRTLSKMNAFDFVVTIALGSTLSSTLLSESNSVWKGVTAMAFLVLAQYSVTWLSVRSGRFQRMIKAEPRLLFHEGKFLEREMRSERVTREEILAALREKGDCGLSAVKAVVLETEGTLSIITGASDCLSGIRGRE